MTNTLTPQRLARIEARIREERELRFATNTVDTLPGGAHERSVRRAPEFHGKAHGVAVTQEVIDEAVRRIKGGETKAAVAKSLNLSMSTIKKYTRGLKGGVNQYRKSHHGEGA